LTNYFFIDKHNNSSTKGISMKFLSLLLAIITITNICGTTFGGENPDGRDDSGASSVAQLNLGKSSLAVLVSCQPGREDLAGQLESLLEAEMSLQWAGQSVERAQMSKLLEELKMSSSGLTDQKSRLKMSQMLHFDCLLAVKVEAESVIARVSLFPSTKVICEKNVYQAASTAIPVGQDRNRLYKSN
jgi:hypothetical protein